MDPTAAELKLKDVGDEAVSISTAPQNRPEAPPMGVANRGSSNQQPGDGPPSPALSLQQSAAQLGDQGDFFHCFTCLEDFNFLNFVH